MRHILLLPFVLALPAFAGPSPSQPMAPSLYTWFAGASVGYLTELEEPMYNLHVGTDTGWDLDVMPITLNVKIEHPITGNLSGYFGAGLGAARVDLDADLGVFWSPPGGLFWVVVEITGK